MTTPWKWTPERTLGIWRHGAAWTRPVTAAIPYLTVMLLLLMLHFVGGTLTSAKGVLFDLPDAGLAEIPGAGHYSFLENPVLFNAIISSFLKL